MKNVDVIAKNLLENKICSRCKFYNNGGFCYRLEPLKLESLDDIEVYVNGILHEENVSYVIKDMTLFILQHIIDPALAQGVMNGDNVVVIERQIKNDKIIKISHRLKNQRQIPDEQTCEGFLDINQAVYNRV